LIKRHFDILQTLADKGRAKDISLSYNTNGSIYPEQHIELLQQFKDVQVFFSIDGVSERFNYIRHPQDFDAVMQNYWKFKNTTGIRTNIFYTVSLFNIMYMDELLTYSLEHNIDSEIHFNMVYVPHHISPKALPVKVKQAITDKFKTHNDHRIQSTLNFMNQEHYEGYMDEFVRQTSFSDKYRNESFAETFPELWKYMEPYFKNEKAMDLINQMQVVKAGNKHDRI